MLVIGELINASGKKVKNAIINRDSDFIAGLAKKQEDAGADYIDVNVATGSGDQAGEVDDMKWAVNVIKEAVDKPMAIDTTDYNSLEAGLECCGEGTFINSVSAEGERLDSFLELAKKYSSPVVALPIREGIPETVEGRLEVCKEIINRADTLGVQRESLYFDPLALPVSVDSNNARITLDTLKKIKEYNGVKSTIGLSNISYGLPQRELINSSFLLFAMQLGLDSAIMNPMAKGAMAAVKSGNVLLGKDYMCAGYLKAYRAGILG